MKLTTRKAGAIGLGLALVVGVGGIASAADLGWYDGGNTAVADPDRTSVPLKIYNAAGTAITTGSTTAPIGAFVAADNAVRAGDTYASVFLHRPDAGSTPGAWSGAQATGTTKFDVNVTNAPNGKPFVAVAAGSTTIADFATSYPTTASAGTYKDVYELRLRTSSTTGGVSNAYASAFVKVTGTTWAITAAPTAGGPTDPTPTTPVPTKPAPTTPAPPAIVKIAGSKPTIKVSKTPTSKKAGKATVTVKPAAGRAQPKGKVTITFKKGSTSKKVSATLSNGKKSIKVPKLKKGTWKVTVAYAGDTNYLSAKSKSVNLLVKK